MIIDYDHNPNISTDQKLQSLKENVQMALDELNTAIDGLRKEIEKIKENQNND